MIRTDITTSKSMQIETVGCGKEPRVVDSAHLYNRGVLPNPKKSIAKASTKDD